MLMLMLLRLIYVSVQILICRLQRNEQDELSAKTLGEERER